MVGFIFHQTTAHFPNQTCSRPAPLGYSSKKSGLSSSQLQTGSNLSTSKYLLVSVNTQIFETLPVVLVAGVPFGNSCNSAIDACDDMSCLRHSRGPIGSGGQVIGRSTN